MRKSTYKNILTYYPKIKREYEEDIDFDTSILKSPFTVTIMNLKGYVIPLILSLLLDSNFHYLFVYADSSDPYRQILINAVINIKKTHKCEIREGPVDTSDIDAKDMVYISVDDFPIKPAKRKGVKLPERTIVLLVTEFGSASLKLFNRDSTTKFATEIEDIQVMQLVSNDESYYDESENLARFDRKNINPLSKETLERIKIKTKKKKSTKKKPHEEEKPKKSTKKKPSESSDSDEIKKPSKKKPSESSDEIKKPSKKKHSEEEKPKKKINKDSNEIKKQKKPTRELSSSDEETEKHSLKNRRILDDEKFDLTVKPNHSNIISSKDSIPTKGGWIEDYKGITTFYIMGADKLKGPEKDVDRSSEKYITSFFNYLTNLLTLFIDDKKAVDIMTTDKNLKKLWLKAWTHETYDIIENYETLEIIGDGNVGYSFISFIFNKDPSVDEGELTALKSKACDKNAFRQISWELKMDKWLRMGGDAKSNTNTAEDVVESFCGVLQIAGSYYLENNKTINYIPGAGIKYIYNFIEFLYGKAVFTPEMYISDPKTSLLQAAEGLGGGIGIGNAIVEEFSSNMSSHVHSLTLSWSSKAMKALEVLGKKQKKEIISVNAGSKKTVIAKAYFEAFKVLEKRGTSVTWLRETKKESKWKSYDENLIKKAMKKLHKEHGDNATLELYMPKSLNGISSTTIMLLAIVPDGTRKGKPIKLGVISGDETDQLRVNLLENYANGK